MGCDIHIVAQRRNEVGEWVEVRGDFAKGPSPFDWRSYAMFAFLAGVRNYSAITPISEPRGLPDDLKVGEWYDEDYIDVGEHNFSWLTVDELAAIDYDQIIEDRRVRRQVGPNVWSGGQTCDPGEGEATTLREFLGTGFMGDLAKLKELGAERIVFGFDN